MGDKLLFLKNTSIFKYEVFIMAFIIALAPIMFIALAMARRSTGLEQWYWASCALLMLIGVACAVYVVAHPPEHFDEAGRLIGEMPPEFALACKVVVLGLAGAIAGISARVFLLLRRRVGSKHTKS
jgi:hypothetical protein